MTVKYNEKLFVPEEECASAEFLQFAIWCGSPAQVRKPETQKKFSILFGIPQKTLNKWKRDEQFQGFVKQTRRDWASR